MGVVGLVRQVADPQRQRAGATPAAFNGRIRGGPLSVPIRVQGIFTARAKITTKTPAGAAYFLLGELTGPGLVLGTLCLGLEAPSGHLQGQISILFRFGCARL